MSVARAWAQKRLVGAAAAALLGVTIGLALFFIHLPYYIFAPGAALDLDGAVFVPHHTPPRGSLYLTDVEVIPGRPFYYALAKLLPGFDIVRRERLVPRRVSDEDLNRQLVDGMKQSQQTASLVAERAAGLQVRSTSSFTVARVIDRSPAAKCLRPGDVVVAINDRPIENQRSLAKETASHPAGTVFRLSLRRGGKPRVVKCATFAYRGKARFGVSVQYRVEAYRLPLQVAFRLPNINGSSAGLMFALQIYRTLSGRVWGGGRSIAGTGVINPDGTVDPIEGTRQKLRAAQKAGATVFILPAENYDDVRGVAGMAIIPVKNFSQALSRLAALPAQR